MQHAVDDSTLTAEPSVREVITMALHDQGWQLKAKTCSLFSN